MVERLRKVTHRGCTILFTDYSGFSAWQDWQALIEAERKLMPGEPLGSVRALALFTGSRFSPEVVEAIKQLAVANKPYMKVSALVGLSDFQQSVFLKGIERTSDRSFALFDDVEPAMAWLADQQ